MAEAQTETPVVDEPDADAAHQTSASTDQADKGQRLADGRHLSDILRLHRAWLRGAKGGVRANLRGADLSDAVLRGAVLSDAVLRGANLSDADLRGAVLWGCVGNMSEIKSLQLERYRVTYTADRLQIGCKNFSIDEWWSFSDAAIDRMDRGSSLAWWGKFKCLLQTIIATSPAEPTGVPAQESAD